MENKRALILTQMWMAGETAEAIGNRFGVSGSTVYKWVQKYKLPDRKRTACEPVYDPSPEEIERMKAEIKARHIAERMAEQHPAMLRPAWMGQPYWVDPPSGYRYGFPKLYDPARDGNVTEWLIRQGYPEALARQGLPCTMTSHDPDTEADDATGP